MPKDKILLQKVKIVTLKGKELYQRGMLPTQRERVVLLVVKPRILKVMKLKHNRTTHTLKDIKIP